MGAGCLREDTRVGPRLCWVFDMDNLVVFENLCVESHVKTKHSVKGFEGCLTDPSIALLCH